MGASVSWLSSLLWVKKEIRILILGLVRRPVARVFDVLPRDADEPFTQDNAGKTTLLYRLKVRHPNRPRCDVMLMRRHDLGRRGRHNHTHHRVQRRVRVVQESQL